MSEARSRDVRRRLVNPEDPASFKGSPSTTPPPSGTKPPRERHLQTQRWFRDIGGGIDIVAAAAAASGGAAALWPLWEQDVWWQIRAGTEGLLSGRFISADSWSYTVPGTEWRDVQWIATATIASAYHLAGVPGLVVLRGLLVALLLLGVQAGASAAGLRTFAAGDLWKRSLVTAAAFGAMRERLQIRSELFLMVLCAWAFPLFTKSLLRAPSGGTSLMQPWLALAPLVLLGANLHFGIVPFLGFISCSLLAGHRSGALSPIATAPFCLGLAALALCNPQPLYALKFFWFHVFYFEGKKLENPDHQRFALEKLLGGDEKIQISLTIWLLLTLLAPLMYMMLKPELRPPGYKNPLVAALTFSCLTAGVMDRIRVVPFATIYLLPVLAAFLAHCVRIPQVVTAVVLLLMVSLYCWREPEHLGFNVAHGLWPISSAAFLMEHLPRPNVYHTHTFGGYLVWHARDKYKVYGDTRETIFKGLEDEYLQAYHSPEATRALLDRWNVSTILTKIPQTQQLESGHWINVVESYTPKKDWALVHFDSVSIVLLRRVKGNKKLIRRFEYMYLTPHLPYSLFLVSMQQWDGQKVRRFRDELLRCLKDLTDSLWCWLCAGTWADTVQDPEITPELVLGYQQRLSKRWAKREDVQMVAEKLRAKAGKPAPIPPELLAE